MQDLGWGLGLGMRLQGLGLQGVDCEGSGELIESHT